MREIVIEVPADMVRFFGGVSLDFGGSNIKCVYKTKENVDELADTVADSGYLNLVLFNRSEINECLDYIRQRAFLQTSSGKRDEPRVLYTTGLGCAQFGKLIGETFHARIEVLTEFVCIGKAFYYLVNRQPRRTLLEEFDSKSIAEVVDYGKAIYYLTVKPLLGPSVDQSPTTENRLLGNFREATGFPRAAEIADQTSSVSISETEPEMFPCILAIVGSSSIFLEIQADGSMKFVDFNSSGGKLMLGVGGLITGCKDFEEFVELAQKGNHRNVDVTSHDAMADSQTADDDKNFYESSKAVPEVKVYDFGKTTGRTSGDFKREDITRAWLNHVMEETVRTIHLVCNVNGVKRVFFCGGMSNDPFIRHRLAVEMAKRNVHQFIAVKREPLLFDFVKPGPYLGALGCILSDIEAQQKSQSG